MMNMPGWFPGRPMARIVKSSKETTGLPASSIRPRWPVAFRLPSQNSGEGGAQASRTPSPSQSRAGARAISQASSTPLPLQSISLVRFS